MEKELFESQIRSALGIKALAHIKSLTEDLLPVNGAVSYSMSDMTNRVLGKIAIVNRIRNGKLQLNKKVDVMGKGYKLLPNGLVVRMSQSEIRNRARAAKVAVRKRQAEMFQILRNRTMSDKRRDSFFGG